LPFCDQVENKFYGIEENELEGPFDGTIKLAAEIAL
jgi:hypothetical protein